MKRLFPILMLVCASCQGGAQTADEKVGEMLNTSNFFELERCMRTGTADSLSTYIGLLARAVSAHYFNRPAEAVQTIETLLADHSDELGGQSAFSMALFKGKNLARMGSYGEAADWFDHMADRLADAQAADSATIDGLRAEARMCKIYASMGEMCVARHEPGTHTASFFIDSRLHGYRKGGFLSVTGAINSTPTTIAFDTGAGINVVSPEDARKMKLRYVDADMPLMGIGRQMARMAVADTLRLGRDMVWTNVPFAVVDITTGNSRADEIISRGWPPTVGIPLLLRAGEMRIDCTARTVSFTTDETAAPPFAPNLLMKDTNLLRALLHDKDGKPVYMHFDTGNYNTSMNSRWYNANKKMVRRQGTPDSLRRAGVGGVEMMHTYKLPAYVLNVGDEAMTIDSLTVVTGIDLHTGRPIDGRTSALGGDDRYEDGSLGLDLIEHFGRITINLDHMFILCDDPGNGLRREWLFD